MEKVSVVIPAYNSARYIGKTLDSVMNQSYPELEIILVDDGSTDNTKDVIKPYLDKIVYFFQENSGGPASPRNVGVALATSNYISFLDSDDLMMRDKIEKEMNLFTTDPTLHLVFTNFLKIDEKENTKPREHIDSKSLLWSLDIESIGDKMYKITGKKAYEELLINNFIGTSGVIVKKEIVERIGGFDESVTKGGLEDRDLWLKVAYQGDLGYLDEIMHVYQIRKSSISRRTLEAAKSKIMVANRHRKGVTNINIQKNINKNLSKWHADIAKYHRINRNYLYAAKCYTTSFFTKPNYRAIKGIIKLAMSTLKVRN
jgi:glycosyltransferase involved in cell wall biosynthesis